MVEQERQLLQETYRRRLSIEEFLVDFLGSLVPGVLFISATSVGLFPPFHALTMALSTPFPEGATRSTVFQIGTAILEGTRNTPTAVWIIIFVGAALIAYITGHLFYRHDPKQADRSSLRRLIGDGSELKKEELDERKTNFGCSSVDDCEFPYPYMDKYLKKRGLKHLQPFILWSEKKKKVDCKSENYRSKNYINILKIRLRFHYPERNGTIIRNEAHVRLASSTWYAARLLMGIGLSGLLITALSIFLSSSDITFSGLRANIAWHIPAIIAPFAVLIFSAYAWWSIRGFLHYQRMREVIFVLETAYTAFKDEFERLEPPFNSKELSNV